MNMTAGDWLGVVAVFAVVAVIGWLRQRADKARARKGEPPREPLTDLSPFFLGLTGLGAGGTAYTAKVRAVTPLGVTVSQGRCCQRGHQTPAQAVTHAAAIARRIERTGR